MPVISKFYGIIIRILKLSNRRTAIYANYGEQELVMDAATLRVISGTASARTVELVSDWARQHQEELMQALDQAKERGSFSQIAPLH